MKVPGIVITFLFLLTLSSWGQTGNTVISRYGIGELNAAVNTRGRGMGYLSTPLVSESDISHSNPAAWAFLRGIRLQGDLSLETESFDRYGTSVNSSALKGLQVSFPVDEERGISIVTGFMPVSSSNYSVTSVVKDQDREYTRAYEGSGGLSMFRLGASWRPFRSWAIGASYQYVFGTMRQSWTADFGDDNLYNSYQSNDTHYQGSNLSAGVLYTGIGDLTMGLSLTTPVTLSANLDYTMEYSTRDSVISGLRGDQDLPLKLDVGLAWQAHRRLLVAGDLSLQKWTDAVSFQQQGVRFTDAIRYGAGLEWVPASHEGSPFWSRTALRLGFYHAVNYVKLVDEEETMTAVTAGVGFPIVGRNRMDLSFEYGRRGSDAQVLGIRDYGRIHVSVSVMESWFKRWDEE